MEAMEVTGAGSGRQVEGMEVHPASVSSTAPPARGCSAASAGPTAVPPVQKRIEKVGFKIDVKKIPRSSPLYQILPPFPSTFSQL